MVTVLSTDAELVSLLKTGDKEAFVVLYERYWERLYAFAYMRLRSREVAEDLVQNIFIRLWSNRTKLNIENLNAYFSASLKYEVLDYLRSQAVRQKHQARLSRNNSLLANDTQDTLNFEELHQELQQSLELLPEKCRLVFQMSRNEGLTLKEIALRLDVTPKTVEFHISKALKMLRLSLKDFLYLIALLFHS